MPTDTNREEKEKVWFRETRHVEPIQGASLETLKHKDDWRRICERMKTVSVALVLCLNIGTDPPDVQKPHPCARKEAWVDPAEPSVAHAQQRPAQRIAQSLQKIYEKLHPRARYKSAIDPTVDCVRKLCMSMRRNAKNERVLFHFNGHGVPKPSEAGEIWLFNHDITQYIPLSLYELQSWMGTPSVYLWDCNSAGTILNMFMRFAEDHSIRWMEEYREMRDREQLQQNQIASVGTSVADSAAVAAGIAAAFGANAPNNSNNDTASSTSTNSHPTIPSYKNCIQLGACSSGEQLPFHNADLPADLFTCCLTSPIQTSLLCHMLKTGTKNRFPPTIIDEIPGVLSDRRTLLGELNWIFTAITDAIAWCRLPRNTFQRLFRQDLLIASLFRAFLLAERIMRENGCHVVSTPQLPPVHDHPLWEYWDYTLDMCLTNLYNLLQPKQGYIQFTRSDCFVAAPTLKHHLLIDLSLSSRTSEYAYSWFFVEQLQAFEVWLKFGVDKREPPQQLPVVLQVLLSVNHRLRALDLLARFIDMGPWAVISALSVGIFPYVHRLLQCPTPEVRPALAFIWAKILAIDPGCQHELVKDNGYDYFLQVLNDQSVSPRMKIISAFVMATFIYNNYRPAQEKLVQSDYVTLCIELLSCELVTRCRMLVLWLLIGLGRLWAEYDKARWQAIRSVAYDKVVEFLNDDLPEVRAAAVFALGCFVHNTSRNNEHATAVENEVCDKLCEKCTYDGSVLVRAELAAAIQWFVIDFQSRFATICAELDRRVATQSPSLKFRVLCHIRSLESKTFIGPFERIWLCVLRLGLDPFDRVATMGEQIIRYIFELSSKIREARDKALELKQNTGGTRPISVNGPIVNSSASVSQQISPADAQKQQQPHSHPEKVKFLIGTPQGATTTPMPSSVVTPTNGVEPGDGDDASNSVCNSTPPPPPPVPIIKTTTASSTSSSTTPPTQSQQQEQQPQQEQTPVNKKHPPEMDHAKRRLLLDPFIHQSLYTPKRSIFGTQSGSYSQVADANELLLAEQSATVAVEGLVRTSFVEWCGKTWTESIYDTIYGVGRGIPTRNSLVDGASPFTLAQPTDWAIHTHEGIRQRAKKELEVLKKNKLFRCETQIMQLKLERPATSMAWSFLRPYVYIGDGERVRIYSYSTGDELRQQQQQHHQYGADISSQIPQPPPSSTLCSEFWAGSEPFLQDQITDLMVVNELTHELLMSGTRNGLLRVWDPMFHEHSHELLERPKLVTATYMLNDVPRVNGGQNRIIYHWDQLGRLVCAGNVRICRVWDVWAERPMFDVTLKNAKGAVVAVGSELRFDLVSCGFSDGTVALFDIRVPAKGCEVLHLRDSNAPVVGMAMLAGEQRERLLVGTRDGEIRLWEPRMFKEASVEFNVNRVHREGGDSFGGRSGAGYFGGSSTTTAADGQNRLMQQMEVQVQGELIACAMDDASVSLFDIDGRGGVLSRLRWPTSGAGGGARRALLSAAASSFSSFHSPVGAMSGISSLLWGRPRRNSSGGTSVTSGSGGGRCGAENGGSSISVFSHFTSPPRRQQRHQTVATGGGVGGGAVGPPPPAAMRFHQQRVLLGLATAEGQFRAYAMPSNVDSGGGGGGSAGGGADA